MARSDRLLRLLQTLRTLPSPVTAELQTNIRAGHLPEDKNGDKVLRVPINKL